MLTNWRVLSINTSLHCFICCKIWWLAIIQIKKYFIPISDEAWSVDRLQSQPLSYKTNNCFFNCNGNCRQMLFCMMASNNILIAVALNLTVSISNYPNTIIIRYHNCSHSKHYKLEVFYIDKNIERLSRYDKIKHLQLDINVDIWRQMINH